MERSIEQLSHYRCEECGQWFSIGDAPSDLTELYCPRCGAKSEISEAAPLEESG
jgi:DNA-directed RNA polymerase subunit RPC12/RpoP